MSITLYTSPYSHRHDTGDGHPENAKRIEALEGLLNEEPFSTWPQKISAPADLEQILLAHGEDYVFDLQDKTPDHGITYLDGDTALSPDSYEAALHGAGAACQAIDDIYMHQAHRLFCATRPPGHHAEPDHAMGFCLFNNIFIAARHAQEEYSIKKIAILDFDVHHGNGTENMCRAHNAKKTSQPILYISSHAHPLFPMSGDPAQNDATTLNIHLPDQCSSAEFQSLYEAQIFPELSEFAPELLLLSSGFDAHKDDPLAPVNLETTDYGWLTRQICDLCPDTPILSILEGGYELHALKDSVRAHLEELGR